MSGSLGILDAVVLGLVEGVTEYLPISSTGHLVLARSLLGLDSPEDIRRNVDAFLIVIQGGAILAVLGLYRTSVLRMIRGVFGNDREGLVLFRNLLIAFLPAAILGPLLNNWIESRLMEAGPVLLALAAGGIVMILVDRRHRHRRRADLSDGTSCPDGMSITAIAAFQIGLLQTVAMWPGTSRSMVTILGGMMVGMRPAKAAEFSFLLGLPTLGGAMVYKLGGNLMGDEANMFAVLGWLPLLVGFAVATISAAIAIKWLVGYLNQHGLAVFGWYRLVLTAVLLALMFGGIVSIQPEGSDQSSDPAAAALTPSSMTPPRPTPNTRG